MHMLKINKKPDSPFLSSFFFGFCIFVCVHDGNKMVYAVPGVRPIFHSHFPKNQNSKPKKLTKHTHCVCVCVCVCVCYFMLVMK